MVNRLNIAPLFWILLCIPVFCGVCQAAAEEQSVRVTVNADFQPDSSLGLVISEDSALQKTKPRVEKHSSGLYVVTFSVARKEIKPGSLATAMLISNMGQVALGDLVSLQPNQPDPAVLALPECSLPPVSIEAVRSQFATLDSLVNLRLRQRDLLRNSIGTELSSETLSKLQQLERGFGLELARPLSAELKPHELFERLARLKTAIANHRANAERRKQESAQPAKN